MIRLGILPHVEEGGVVRASLWEVQLENAQALLQLNIYAGLMGRPVQAREVSIIALVEARRQLPTTKSLTSRFTTLRQATKKALKDLRTYAPAATAGTLSAAGQASTIISHTTTPMCNTITIIPMFIDLSRSSFVPQSHLRSIFIPQDQHRLRSH